MLANTTVRETGTDISAPCLSLDGGPLMHDHIRFLIALGKRGEGMHIFLPPLLATRCRLRSLSIMFLALPPVFFPAGDCLSYPPPRFSKQQPLDDVSRRERGEGNSPPPPWAKKEGNEG